MPGTDKEQARRRSDDRGKRASFDPKSGAVSGSGAGIGRPEGSDEDYATDLDTGSGGPAKGGEPGNAA